MAEPNDSTPPVPPLRDKRTAPLGVIPRHMQGWLLSGIAALMIAVIAFSGRAPKPATAPPLASAPIDANRARIQEFQRRIEEQTRKLQLEQALLAQDAEATLPVLGGGRAGRAGGSSSDESFDWERDSVQSQPLRLDRGLFASNIALSFRQEPGAQALPETSGHPTSSITPNAKPDGQSQPAQLAKSAESSAKTTEGKRYRLFEGTFLETVLTNRLDGSFAGPVNCMVTTNVYSHDGQRLLIPQGSRVLGEAKRVETFGQQRLAVFFHRLILPNGFAVSLDTFQGLNQVGETGLKDRVNRHYWQVFGVSLAIGAIAGFSQWNTRSGLDRSSADLYQQGVADSLSQSSLRILDRYLNVLPTLTIREGHRVKVYLSNDLQLPVYDKHRVPEDF